MVQIIIVSFIPIDHPLLLTIWNFQNDTILPLHKCLKMIKNHYVTSNLFIKLKLKNKWNKTNSATNYSIKKHVI